MKVKRQQSGKAEAVKDGEKACDRKASLASKIEEVDPDFANFLKHEDKDLLEDLGELGESDLDDDNEASDLDLGDDSDAEGDDGELQGEEESDGDESIIPESEDEEEMDEADIKKLVNSEVEPKKRSSRKSDRTLSMAQVNEWSEALNKVISGETNEKQARQNIDHIVAALRCAADKIKPLNEGVNDRSGKKVQKSKKKDEVEDDDAGEEDDSDDESAAKKKRNTAKSKAAEAFSKMFDFVGAREFHAVVKLCISHLVPAFLAILQGHIKSNADAAAKKKPSPMTMAHAIRSSPSWGRLKLSLRVYIETLVDLVKYTTDESLSTELLAHLNTDDAQVLVFSLPSSRRVLVQTVVSIWSKGCLISSKDLLEQCHALIMTTVRNCPSAKVQALYERVFRRLYRAFMAACKFNAKRADEQALQIATTMRNQLATFVLVAPVPGMSHALAFVRVRQLCAQLRAALSAVNAETRARSSKVVLSWPFIRSIDLWIEVVATSPEGHAMRQLVFPLSQLTIGTARLQSSPRYYPLRLHCIHSLNRLASATHTFIPTLSLILDVFSITDFNAAATYKGSAGKDDERRITSLHNILHFSESQLKDSGIDGGMLDAVVNDLLYFGTAETLAAYSNRVAFPELTLALVVRLKKFIKACHVPRYVEKMRVVLQKVEENSKWIEDRRRSATDLHPANSSAVKSWENNALADNPPMVQFFDRIKATLALVNRAVAEKRKRSSVEIKDETNDEKPKKMKFKSKGDRKKHFMKRAKKQKSRAGK